MKVICRNCSSNKAELEYLKFQSARVCDECFSTITGKLNQLNLNMHFYSELNLVITINYY